MIREVRAAGSTLTVGELLEAIGGLDRSVPITLPGFRDPRSILAVVATDLGVLLEPSLTMLEELVPPRQRS